MRKKTARAIAVLLAAVLMTFSVDSSVFADRETDAAGEPSEETSVSSNQAEMIEADMGAVEVVLTAGIQVKADQAFQVLLKGRNGTERGDLTLEAQGGGTPPSDRIRFSALAEGSYQLVVAGDGYITYIQDIEVKKWGSRISLYTGKTAGFSDGARPGLLVYGDVNEDGQLNEADAAEIVAAIEEGREGGSCDLNKDGRVDLLDLNYFTEFSENGQWQQATVETFIPSESVVSRTLGDTQVQEGSLDSVLDGEGQAVLGTVSGNAVSEENPLGVELDFSRTLRTAAVEEIRMASPASGGQSIDAGAVDITYVKNGRTRTKRFSIDRAVGGELRAELGEQLEVRKAVVWITQAAGGTGSQAALTGIDLISDKSSRVAEPEPAVPGGISITPNGSSFTVAWEQGTNVTGYEVEVSFGEAVEIYKTGGNRLEVSQFDKEALKEDGEYEVRVQAVNGAWESGYSQPVAISMKPGRVPEAPGHVSLRSIRQDASAARPAESEAGACSLVVAWEPCENADFYNVFYKAAADEAYEKVERIRDTSYELKGLAPGERYQVYVTASGSLGESQPSLTVAARTMSADSGAVLPEYNLINLSDGAGELSRHIRSASIGDGAVMSDSPLDQKKGSGLGLFDNSQASCLTYEGRSFGTSASAGSEEGVTVELDQVYEVGMIGFVPAGDTVPYTDARVWYWDGRNQRHEAKQVTLAEQGEDGAHYYLIKMDGVRTSKLQIGIGRDEAGADSVSISEIRLYTYDSIEQDIMDLFADTLHTQLKAGVDGEDIQELRQRLDTEDALNGGYHTERQALLGKLDEAQAILDGEKPEGIVEIDPSVSAAYDRELQITGLTDWQPLGVTAAAGEKLTVYVSNPGMEQGEASDLQLYFTQHHGEQQAYAKTQQLRIGRNEVTVPQLSDIDREKGGALYVRYVGENENDRYQVRVDGGSRYPVLNLRRVSEEERESRVQAYVRELDSYVSGLEERHNGAHGEAAPETVRYAYHRAECILNTTDIVTDHVMFSIPASQVLSGLGNSGQEKKLSDAAASMDEMLELFYQHKGLASSFAAGTEMETAVKNHLPDQYLHVRYMEIPAGKLLYAADSHIGIGWNEAGSLLDGVRRVGSDFGRALVYVIGRQLGQEVCGAEEVAAYYFTALAQSVEQENYAGFSYDRVFGRVTSGTAWGAEDELTRSAMYWQLHLAYDRDDSGKQYRNYQELCENLFFARVNSYARNPSSAPTGIEPDLSGDQNQVFMRLASSAAQRDLTEFFTRWGLTPDEETSAYMAQYAPEERAVYYLDDSARAYVLGQGGASGGIAGTEGVTAEAVTDGGKVTVTATFAPEAAGIADAGNGFLQGYEIVRIVTEQGQEKREVVGFTRDGGFTDTLSGIGSRTVAYEVTAIDKWMNRSAPCRTEAVEAEGDGRLDSSFWTVETNMISEMDYKAAVSQANPCGGGTVSAAGRITDGRADTTFTGWSEDEDPYVILKLGRKTPVTALRYTLEDSVDGAPMTPVFAYRIEVSTDGEQYVTAAEGTLELTEGEAMVYFTASQEASYIKLTAVDQKGARLSCTELELYGPSRDYVAFQADQENHLSAGILDEAYVYGTNQEDQVPAGALVLIGEWQGRDPEGADVVLYDGEGDILGGADEDGRPKAGRTILAPKPTEDGEEAAGEESLKGIWLYWMEPGKGGRGFSMPEKVRAELHRNGSTVSDTPFMEPPKELPAVRLER